MNYNALVVQSKYYDNLFSIICVLLNFWSPCNYDVKTENYKFLKFISLIIQYVYSNTGLFINSDGVKKKEN